MRFITIVAAVAAAVAAHDETYGSASAVAPSYKPSMVAAPIPSGSAGAYGESCDAEISSSLPSSVPSPVPSAVADSDSEDCDEDSHAPVPSAVADADSEDCDDEDPTDEGPEEDCDGPPAPSAFACLTETELDKTIPVCASECQKKAFAADGCAYEDVGCHCSKSGLLLGILVPCLINSTCTQAEVTSTISFAMPFTFLSC
jgi:hypothetical protein